MTSDFWSSLWGFTLIAIVIVVMWTVNFFAMPWFFPSEDGTTSAAGSAGDMFGGLTALFSGLAFAGLITTLFMQRKELELQRKELSQTREVFQVQRFENTFFGLMKVLNDQVTSIEIEVRKQGMHNGAYSAASSVNGRSALAKLSDRLPKTHVTEQVSDGAGGTLEPKRGRAKTSEDLIVEYEQSFFRKYEPELGPYFRLIYAILRQIETTEFFEDEAENNAAKVGYSKMLRAHLSSAEIKLLMFNCVSINGSGLKGWVEKYSMLKHIPRSDYNDLSRLVECYKPQAFKFDERKTAQEARKKLNKQ